MLASDDRSEVLKAQQLARFERGTKVEEAFRDRIGTEVAAAAAARLELPGEEPPAQKLASGPDAKAAAPQVDAPASDASNENQLGSDPAALVSDSKDRLSGWKGRRDGTAPKADGQSGPRAEPPASSASAPGGP